MYTGGTPQHAAGYGFERQNCFATGLLPGKEEIKMRYLPDGNQMKNADSHTIHEVGIPSLVLMERAALQTVKVMEEYGIDTSRALVVCGSGNNGGDGFAIARLLREKGHEAEVLFAGKESSLSEECRLQKQIAQRQGIPVFTSYPGKEYTVVIDAVFGVGLSREITGNYLEIIRRMNESSGRKVAVDIASGICSRTGQVLGTAFRAELTVAMACVKLGSVLYPGEEYSGRTVAVPIGIDPEYFRKSPEVCFTYDRADLAGLLPVRRADSHKGTYGKVLMITGCAGMAGAAYLSAAAAYTAGAGLVQIYTAEENRVILQQLLPEAIISCYGTYDEEQLDRLLAWADVVCIGCGLGQSGLSGKLLEHTLETAKVPCVIDADGLNLLSRRKELLDRACVPVILTPHMMEMSRLTGHTVGEIAEDRIGCAAELAEHCQTVCVLKDSRTVVLEKGRQPFVNLAGNSAMAKAGSGDVLAGVITGLLAQGTEPFLAACAGVFLHACGGDEARDVKGSYSVLARDLIAGIQRCMKKSKEQTER